MYSIGVYGSGTNSNGNIVEKAWHIGRGIVKKGNKIITGACHGIPFSAIEGLKSLDGYSIGFTAVSSRETHEKHMKITLKFYDELILIPENFKFINEISVCRKYRNVSSVAECDTAIFISGRWGTINEFSNAYEMGKIISVLEGSGGISDYIKDLVKKLNKETKCKIT